MTVRVRPVPGEDPPAVAVPFDLRDDGYAGPFQPEVQTPDTREQRQRLHAAAADGGVAQMVANGIALLSAGASTVGGGTAVSPPCVKAIAGAML